MILGSVNNADHIAVWMINTIAEADLIREYEHLLDAAELARANRFATDILRSRFVMGRGALRKLIGIWCGLPPQRVSFEFLPNGKPTVPGAQFNVSHSADWVAIAITNTCRVGIDIELIRPIPDYEEIAHAYFSPAELRSLLSVPEGERETAFFRCWTRKEALVKAHGIGLSADLKRFSVTFDKPYDADLEIEGSYDWTLRGLTAPDRYVAAIAHLGPPVKILGPKFLKAADLCGFSALSELA